MPGRRPGIHDFGVGRRPQNVGTPTKAGMTAEGRANLKIALSQVKIGDETMDDQSETIALIHEIRRETHERFDRLNLRLDGLSAAIEARTRQVEMQTDAFIKRAPASRAAALQSSLKGTEL